MTNCYIKIYGSFWVDEDTYGTFEVYNRACFRGILMGKPFNGTFAYTHKWLSRRGVFEVATSLDLDKEIHGNFLVVIEHEDYNYQPHEGTFVLDPRSMGETSFTVLGPFPQFMHESWRRTLRNELVKEYFINLKNLLAIDRKKTKVYPSEEDVYTWTQGCPIDQIKVVILGQDPYHEPGQAHGLAFSVPRGIPIPSSLKNIFMELAREYQYPPVDDINGNLRGWSEQGVLLLNTCLTVRDGEAGSHKDILGWEMFTDAIISYLSENSYGLVFILWGNEAQQKKTIDTSKHFILKGAHPSGISANRRKNGFFSHTADGARNTNIPQYFLECNQILKALGKDEIRWENLY